MKHILWKLSINTNRKFFRSIPFPGCFGMSMTHSAAAPDFLKLAITLANAGSPSSDKDPCRPGKDMLTKDLTAPPCSFDGINRIQHPRLWPVQHSLLAALHGLFWPPSGRQKFMQDPRGFALCFRAISVCIRLITTGWARKVMSVASAVFLIDLFVRVRVIFHRIHPSVRENWVIRSQLRDLDVANYFRHAISIVHRIKITGAFCSRKVIIRCAQRKSRLADRHLREVRKRWLLRGICLS